MHVPLGLLVKSPQLQVELLLSIFLFSLFHCCHPVARGIESHLNHLKLLQAQLMNVFLLHNVQLGKESRRQTLVKIARAVCNENTSSESTRIHANEI